MIIFLILETIMNIINKKKSERNFLFSKIATVVSYNIKVKKVMTKERSQTEFSSLNKFKNHFDKSFNNS